MDLPKAYLQLSAICLAISIALIILTAYDANRYMQTLQGKVINITFNQVLFEGVLAVSVGFVFAFFLVAYFITTNKETKKVE